MDNLPILHPAFILILGAFLIPFLKGHIKLLYTTILPLLVLIYIVNLNSNVAFEVTNPFSFLTQSGNKENSINILRVDSLSKPFGIIFSLNAIFVFLFASFSKNKIQHLASTIYIGASLGTVFSKDLLSFYVFWEIMAIASTIIIFSQNTIKSNRSSFRYIMIHIFGGLVLLSGIIITIIKQGGDISFLKFNFDSHAHLGTWLMIIGILINCACIPFSSWIPNSYPYAGIVGGLVLSAYTTKTAVYALIRGFPGWELLIWIGAIMAIYGVIYSLMTTSIRKVLSYGIIIQIAFMLCAIGLGTKEALSGAVASAFCHILYNSLLWMTTGIIIYKLNKKSDSSLQSIKNLYKEMPLVCIIYILGALCMMAPGTCGFISKPIILHAIEEANMHKTWWVLEICSIGVFLSIALRIPWFKFFNSSKLNYNITINKNIPKTMLISIIVLLGTCIYFGLFPKSLYNLLPYYPHYDPYTKKHIITSIKLMLISLIIFIIFKNLFKPRNFKLIEFDYAYNNISALYYKFCKVFLNGVNRFTAKIFINIMTTKILNFFKSAPYNSTCLILTPIWIIKGFDKEEIENKRENIFNQYATGTTPIGVTAFYAVIILGSIAIFSIVKIL